MAFGVVLGVALAVGAGIVAPPTMAGPAGGIYVALGESGAAGPFIPNQVPPLGCFRSDRNYAHLTATALGLALRDVTCSGAKIQDAYTPQQLLIGGVNGAQLDAVTADATIVTVDFGINDYDTGDRSTVASKFGALLDDIRTRAPRATIFVVDKVERIRAGGCFPQVPIPAPQADAIDATVTAVNTIAGAQAAAHGAVLVDVYPASVGHDACAAEDIRWAEGVIPESPAQPLHANARGHENEALMLQDAIRLHT